MYYVTECSLVPSMHRSDLAFSSLFTSNPASSSHAPLLPPILSSFLSELGLPTCVCVPLPSVFLIRLLCCLVILLWRPFFVSEPHLATHSKDPILAPNCRRLVDQIAFQCILKQEAIYAGELSSVSQILLLFCLTIRSIYAAEPCLYILLLQPYIILQ